MASELERFIFNVDDNPEFPYHVCREFFRYSFPDHGLSDDKESELLIVLCDIALNSFHPGEHFVRTIDYIKKTNIFDIHKLYEISDNLSVQWNGTTFKNKELHNPLAQLAISQLKNIINRDTHKDLIDWAEDLLESGRVLRTNINFIKVLCTKTTQIDRIQCFNKTINYLGTPVIIDKNGELGFENLRHKCGEKAFYLVGLQSIFNLLRGFEKGCELRTNCKKTIPDIYDEHNCNCEPWLQISKESFCPYMQVWKTWGLAGKIPNTAP